MDRGFNTITSSLKVSPISEPEFDILFSPILVKDVSQIAVGVSGGPDSLALSWLLHRWCEQIGIRLIALTVDHRLRPNSSKDARNVFLWLKSWGLNCIILPWVGNKPSTGIQETARIARYKLMIDWCIENGVRDLALAHHQEDQAETFLMRLSRGSGIDGLACMREVTLREGVRLLRPLLTLPKSRLRATLKSQNQEWLEDPANSNPAFTRTLIRDLSILLSEREVGTQRLAHLSEQFGRIRVRLEEITRLVVDRAAIIHPTGWATINGELLIHLPDEIGRRVMIFLLQSIGGRSYPPRRKRLDRIMTFIKDPDHCTAFSLGGCSISRQDHQFTILREELRQTAASPIFFAGSVMWRGIFRCTFEGGPERGSLLTTLAPLGRKGWAQLVHEQPEVRNSNIAYPVALTLPALFDVRGVVNVPHLNYNRKDYNTGLNSTNLKFISAKFVSLEER